MRAFIDSALASLRDWQDLLAINQASLHNDILRDTRRIEYERSEADDVRCREVVRVAKEPCLHGGQEPGVHHHQGDTGVAGRLGDGLVSRQQQSSSSLTRSHSEASLQGLRNLQAGRKASYRIRRAAFKH